MNNLLCFRLKPNQDLKKELQELCISHNISAGCILSAVGSLSQAKLRLASSQDFFIAQDNFEIVSMTGTVSKNGSHIHASFANKLGQVIGGHLVDGNLIYTTCELVILKLDHYEFKREHNEQTGFNELTIKKL